MLIGIIDSGLGGYVVAKRVSQQLPNQKMLVLTDKENFPYGDKSKDFVINKTHSMIKELERKRCDLVVLACNTITALVLPVVAELTSLPVLDIITPTAKRLNKNYGYLGVVGTNNTIESGVWQNKLPGKVKAVACPELAPAIEEQSGKEELTEIISNSLKQLLNVDCLILGCTHYSIVASQIKMFLPRTQLIDPAQFVALEIKLILGGKQGVPYRSQAKRS